MQNTSSNSGISVNKIQNLESEEEKCINGTGEPKTNLNSKAENHIQANKNGVNEEKPNTCTTEPNTNNEQTNEQTDPISLEIQNKHIGPNNELQHGKSNKENQDSNQRYLEQSSRIGRKRVHYENEWKKKH